MAATRFDTVVIGQGLAGTTLAWALRRRGQRVLLIDREEPATASRVAAGLITPITGLRLVKSWRFDEFLPAATAFYRFVEKQTESTFFHSAPAVRLFADENERRLANRLSAEDVAVADRHVDETQFHAPARGCEMLRAARLDVPHYLAVSRAWFLRDGCCCRCDVQPHDLQCNDGAVALPRLGARCDRVVFCQGVAAAANPWFQAVRFDAAKGEILTVKVPGLTEHRVVHCGVWLAPLGNGLFKVGATYDRDRLDDEPTAKGRAELCERLRQFLRVPFEVVGQEAAVRPILMGKRPAIGFHPAHPRLGYFNGLGSKGALQAPWVAEHFAAVIAGDAELLPEFDVSRRADLTTCV